MNPYPDFRYATATLLAVACLAANAGEVYSPWTLKATPQASIGTYSGAPTRDRVSGYGVFVDGQYLERGGITLGATHSDLKYKLGLPTLRQDSAFISGRLSLTPDALPGRLTFRLDLHQANNTDTSKETDGVRVAAPQISFMNFDNTFYIDLGYAGSRYGNSAIGNGSLRVRQWTPTLGFAFNGGADWLQLRAYDVRVDNSRRALDTSRTNALEAKWTRYFTPQGMLPEQIEAGALLGKRIYGVDGDAASVYNLADVQRGGAFAGARWTVGPLARLLLSAGYDRYETSNGASRSNYTARYLYGGVSFHW